MKFILIVLYTALVPLLSFAQEKKYSIQGRVGNWSAPAKAYLVFDGLVDSMVMKTGTFQFMGSTDQPKWAYIVINPLGNGYTSAQIGHMPFKLLFYLEPGKISVASADTISNATVRGGPLNTDYAALNAQLKSTYEALRQNINDSQVNAIAAEQRQIYLQFIKDHPNSLMSLFVLRAYAGFGALLLPNIISKRPALTELDSLYHSLGTNVLTGKNGVEFGEEIARKKSTAIGAMAPGFSQADTAGKIVSLHDFKGRHVLIDFWASWCSPCRYENPNLVKAYNKYQSKGFSILGVSLNLLNEKEQWLKAIHKDNLTWPQVSDLKGWKNEVAKLYAITGVPQNFLIGPDGKIIAIDLYGDALEKTLSEIFFNQ